MFNVLKKSVKTTSIFAIATLTLGLGLGACDQQGAMYPEEPGTDVEDVAEDPNTVVGEQVELMGEVEEIIGPNAFRLEEEGELIDDDSVLVIDVAATEPIAEDQEVRVIGEVRPLVIAEVERDYDLTWDADIREQIEAEYEGRPVVIAESTMLVAGTE
ncbi:MAG: hypothetical protein ACLFV6_05370 [Spirulinaceae cyanobacterium]